MLREQFIDLHIELFSKLKALNHSVDKILKLLSLIDHDQLGILLETGFDLLNGVEYLDLFISKWEENADFRDFFSNSLSEKNIFSTSEIKKTFWLTLKEIPDSNPWGVASIARQITDQHLTFLTKTPGMGWQDFKDVVEDDAHFQATKKKIIAGLDKYLKSRETKKHFYFSDTLTLNKCNQARELKVIVEKSDSFISIIVALITACDKNKKAVEEANAGRPSFFKHSLGELETKYISGFLDLIPVPSDDEVNKYCKSLDAGNQGKTTDALESVRLIQRTVKMPKISRYGKWVLQESEPEAKPKG
ncbi:MAG: hypothetical protein NTZ67_03545 [Gammaproteobacteria bacterium]|nr:hypothetical protein [Gammaproteobacteria bacterium]